MCPYHIDDKVLNELIIVKIQNLLGVQNWNQIQDEDVRKLALTLRTHPQQCHIIPTLKIKIGVTIQNQLTIAIPGKNYATRYLCTNYGNFLY